MGDSDHVAALNLSNLDVEGLERRLEMIEPSSAEGYYCNSDCTDHRIVQPDPVDE